MRLTSTLAKAALIGNIPFFGIAALLLGTLCLQRPVAAEPPANGEQKEVFDSPCTAGPPTVTLASQNNADITIYGSQFAQVQESRTVKLQAGTNLIKLEGISAQYRPDSLRINSTQWHPPFVKHGEVGARNKIKPTNSPAPSFTFRSATYTPANLNYQSLLREQIGHTITATQNGTNPITVTGKLESFDGTMLAIKTADGPTRLLNANDITVNSFGTLSNSATLTIECDASVEGTYTIDFLYETNGLTWSAQHSLEFDEANSLVNDWQTFVTINNTCGTSFQNATVRLQSAAAAQGAQGNGPRHAYRSFDAMAESAPGGAPEAAVENLNDQKSYTVPGNVTLNDGQSRQVQLFHRNDVKVERTYVVAQGAYGYRYGSLDTNSAQPVQIRLLVDNCKPNNMGVALPAGPVKVYQKNSAGKLQITGSATLSEKAENEKFNMVIGTSSDVKWESKQVANPNPKTITEKDGRVFEERTFEIKVTNFKLNQDVKVSVEINIDANTLALGNGWNKKSANQASNELVVGKNGSSTVEYSIRFQVR